MRRHATPILLLFATTAVAQTTAPTPPSTTELKRTLQTATPADRTAVLHRVNNGGLRTIQPDDELLSLLDACASDASVPLRSEAASLVGLKWIQARPPLAPQSLARAIDIEARLAEDVNATVRHEAVSAGLKWAADKNAVVVRGLVDAAIRPYGWNDRVAAQVVFGLNGRCGGPVDPAMLSSMLEPFWAAHDDDPDRAAAAYVLYLGATGTEPPSVERLDTVGRFLIWFDATGNATEADIRAELRTRLTPPLVSAVRFDVSRGRLQGALAVTGVARRRQVLDALRYSSTLTLFDDIPRYGVDLITASQLNAFEAEAATRPATTAPSARTDYVSTFADLYRYLGRAYPEFAMKQIDWPAVGDLLLPRSKQVKSDVEFGLLVEQLVARLQGQPRRRRTRRRHPTRSRFAEMGFRLHLHGRRSGSGRRVQRAA